MSEAMLDVERVRPFLGGWCEAEILERLEASRVAVDQDGPLRLFYEAPGRRVVRLAARRMGPGEGPRLEEDLNRRCRSPAPQGAKQPALYVPGLGFLFQVFPADLCLESLATSVDGRAMAPILGSVLGPKRAGARVRGVDVEVVRYKPEQKCVLRYDITWAGGEREMVYAKVAEHPKFERASEALARLGTVAEGLLLRLPEPLGAVPSLGLELFAPMHGLALSDRIDAKDFPELCARAGAGLHGLHGLPVILAEERDLSADLARLAAGALELAWLLPGRAGHSEALRRELGARLAAAAPPRPRPIHGDFHMDNVVVCGAHLGLLDLEDSAMGDPAADVGSAWAQLTWLAIKGGVQASMTAAGRRAFLAAYLELTDPETARRIPLRAALSCFLFAGRCLCHLRRRARHTQAEALLAACEALLERGAEAVDVLPGVRA